MTGPAAKYLLDSSALFAHLFDEAGAEDVRALFHDAQAEVSLSILTAIELFAALNSRGGGDRFDEIWQQYRRIVDSVRPVDEPVVMKAVELRRAVHGRLPNGDAIIAATAVVIGATLVHRDAHFLAIPPELLQQRGLPEK
jgi:predicted nucleic acid-binding protein